MSIDDKKQGAMRDGYKLHEKEDVANFQEEIRVEIRSSTNTKESKLKKFVWTCNKPNMPLRGITENSKFGGRGIAQNWRIKKFPEKPGSRKGLDLFPPDFAGNRPHIELARKIKIKTTTI